MGNRYRRVNIMLGEDQYQVLAERGLNVSGLIRDLLGDYLSDHVVSIQVGEETRRIYDMVVSNTGSTDREVEVHLRKALAKVLDEKIEQMRDLHAKLANEAQDLK